MTYSKQFYFEHQYDQIGLTDYKFKDLPNWAKHAYYLQQLQTQQTKTKLDKTKN